MRDGIYSNLPPKYEAGILITAQKHSVTGWTRRKCLWIL